MKLFARIYCAFAHLHEYVIGKIFYDGDVKL